MSGRDRGNRPSRLGSMPGIRSAWGALAIVACVIGLTACGGGDDTGPIPREQGDLLLAQLDQIESAAQEGLCEDAQATALSFAQGVNDLPPEVEGDLRQALVKASANLEELATEQCDPVSGATGDAGTEPTTTETTTTTEPTTTETTTTEEPPSNGNQGNGPPEETPGNGNPSGNSGGGDASSGGIGSDG
jgi:hypothetical protein